MTDTINFTARSLSLQINKTPAMQNKKIILVLLFTSVCTIVNSQVKLDSVKIKKNEISINLLPFISSFSGLDIDQPNFPLLHINYKRSIKNNIALRIGFAISNNPEKNNIYNPQLTQIYPAFNQLKIKYNTNEGIGEIRGTVGIEKRWGKKIVQQFAGLDLGYSYYNNSKKEYVGLRDSISIQSVYSIIPPNNNDSLINFSQKKVNSIVLTPFYGIKLNMSKRFFLSAQIGYDFKFSKHSFSNINSNFVKPLDYTSVDLNTNGISTNIMLGFRF